MNAKILTAVFGLLLLVPAGYAGIRFGDCPSGYDCEETPDDGGPFPPHAVTAHTIYAKFIQNAVDNETFGLPTDFAAIAGYFALNDNRTLAVQRECVVWFNGYNLDQRPAPDGNFAGAENSFPSDEDEAIPDDVAYQDYDFDRDVDNCLPAFDFNNTTVFPAFAVAVEAGDCDADDGDNFRFRGHLDFVDPNGIYHEVQEYDYTCFFMGPGGGLLQSTALGPDGQLFGGGLVPDATSLVGLPFSDVVKDFFPWTYTDPHNEDGCAVIETPLDNAAPPADLGFFDFGHKCNGSIQDLFTERLWITPVHATVFDPTILDVYNFALQIDTCAGINIYEGPTPLNSPGKDAMGPGVGAPAPPPNMGENSWSDPQGTGPANQLDLYHSVAYDTYYVTLGLDAVLGGWPLFDVCTDGSSYSFDDTPRGRTVHAGPPPGIGSTEIMRGNSYDFDPASDTVGKHRTNCRHNFIDWSYNTFPPGPPPVGDDCYPEDHKTAQIDIYVYFADPTGLFAVNTNGLTGPSAYAGPGIPNGPNEFPPYGP